MSYKLKDFPYSSHKIIAQLLEEVKAKKILDVGCDKGFIGRILTYHPNVLIGIDRLRFNFVPKNYSMIYRADVEKSKLFFLKNKEFEAIIFADILEHLCDPDEVLDKFLPFLSPQGYLIISVPNMDFFVASFLLFFGVRPKMNKGPFDKTHLHDFNKANLEKLLSKHRLKIDRVIYTPIPLPVLSRLFDQGGSCYRFYEILNFYTNIFPKKLSYQIIIVAKSLG